MKRLIIYLFLLIICSSCQEEVKLELNTVEPQLVIEAVWTDNALFNFVKISQSKDYYAEEDFDIINNANVFIRDVDSGAIFPFRYLPQSESYLPVNATLGRIGSSYSLHVEWEGNEYVSNGTLLEPPTLDSLTFKFKDERVFRDAGYYLTLYGDIPFVEDNFYRIRIIKNDTLLNNRGDYLLFDDTFGTSILNRGFELAGYPFEANDRVRLELFRMNRDAFDYLNQLVGLLFNDGGLFSPPPQNPVSNIRLVMGDQEPLGYFMVSPILTQSITIEPED
jgi:hypothetical protein